ncbi:MAG: hypothetical protein V3T39_07270 [Gammaproteobacteria bacterium]
MNLARTWLACLFVALLAGCAADPPSKTDNICTVFEQNPKWYDWARASQKKWGTPIPIQIAFVRQESAFKSKAKPAREWFLFIPLGRPSSAKGYAQAQDPVWKEYKKERGGLFKSRTDMKDALDFIGWYNHRSNRRLGIAKTNARHLYYAYHEGHGGYKRGSYRNKPQLQRVSSRVANTAQQYTAQLKKCEKRFRCRHWWQFWPFCRKGKD